MITAMTRTVEATHTGADMEEMEAISMPLDSDT